MKRFFLSAVLFFCVASLTAQVLRTHTIDAKDTLETIAQRYGVLPEDISALNPGIDDILSVGKILVIPNPIEKKTKETKEIQELVSYKVHRVKRKETLYRIAEKYKISVEDIKKHNQRLYSSPLQFKDKIYIPKYKTKTIAVVPKAVRRYTVLPKEGKWRVAYKFGISVQELEALNPNLNSVLQAGQKLYVPNIDADQEQEVSDDRYGFYKVLPKEGFYRLFKKLGVRQEVLEELNPVLLETGLKVGMVLKVPNSNLASIDLEAREETRLADQLKFLRPKKIALILPFKAKLIDFDSTQLAKQQIQRDGYIRISTEFYAGVEMALDSAKRLGISTDLDVFDSEADLLATNSLLRNNDFSQYDFVLGPLTALNSNSIAEALQSKNIPVVSPFVKFERCTPNLIQTIPNDDWMADKLLRYAETDSIPHQTLIISDSKSLARAQKIRTFFPDALLLNSQRNEEGQEQYYIQFEIVQNALKAGRTVVFLETNNEGFASNVTSMLNGLNGVTMQKDETDGDKEEEEYEIERELILMTTNRNKAFMGANISNTDLSGLNFQFPSVQFYNEELSGFEKVYNARFGIYPTRYATRGFDLTLDLLLRLAAYDSIYEQLTTIETKYLENKFRYVESQNGGYVNQSAYILKYENLHVVKVQD